MTNYEESKEVNEIAKELIPKMGWLDLPRIKFLVLIAERSSYLGKCSKATGKWRHLTSQDYVIEVFEKYWSTATIEQKQALLFHELLHIISKEKDDGTIVWGIRKHEVEEFLRVVEEYGAWSLPLVELLKAHIEYESNKKVI